jgi:hypothetical protein
MTPCTLFSRSNNVNAPLKESDFELCCNIEVMTPVSGSSAPWGPTVTFDCTARIQLRNCTDREDRENGERPHLRANLSRKPEPNPTNIRPTSPLLPTYARKLHSSNLRSTTNLSASPPLTPLSSLECFPSRDNYTLTLYCSNRGNLVSTTIYMMVPFIISATFLINPNPRGYQSQM